MIFFLIALRDLVDLLLSDSGVVTDDNGGINIALPRPVITAAEGADHIQRKNVLTDLQYIREKFLYDLECFFF